MAETYGQVVWQTTGDTQKWHGVCADKVWTRDSSTGRQSLEYATQCGMIVERKGWGIPIQRMTMQAYCAPELEAIATRLNQVVCQDCLDILPVKPELREYVSYS